MTTNTDHEMKLLHEDFEHLCADRDRLAAENERLRAERAKREADFEPLLDEILRLRAALTDIMQGARSVDYAIHVARVALANTP